MADLIGQYGTVKLTGNTLAERLGRELFAMREKTMMDLVSVEVGIDQALAARIADLARPVVIADTWDNPGGGIAGLASWHFDNASGCGKLVRYLGSLATIVFGFIVFLSVVAIPLVFTNIFSLFTASLFKVGKKMSVKLAKMAPEDVRTAYRRWAPFYDATFGKLVEAGIKQTVTRANQLTGRLLEVGVGTGLALPHYGSQLQVTGIDLSVDMLERARKRLHLSGKENVEALLEMDATALQFPDAHFDVAVAMYVLTVVPEPAKVIEELARVTKPGGTVLIANHFSVENGLRGIVEKKMSNHAAKLGWRPDFPVSTVLCSEKLRVCDIQQLRPWGFFTLLEFRRLAS